MKVNTINWKDNFTIHLQLFHRGYFQRCKQCGRQLWGLSVSTTQVMGWVLSTVWRIAYQKSNNVNGVDLDFISTMKQYSWGNYFQTKVMTPMNPFFASKFFPASLTLAEEEGLAWCRCQIKPAWSPCLTNSHENQQRFQQTLHQQHSETLNQRRCTPSSG